MAKMVAAVPAIKPPKSATWYTSIGTACVCTDRLLLGRTETLLCGSRGWLEMLRAMLELQFIILQVSLQYDEYIALLWIDPL